MRNKVFRVTDRMLMRRYYRKTVRFIKNLSGKCKGLAKILTQGEGLSIMTYLGVMFLLTAACFFGIFYMEAFPVIILLIIFLYFVVGTYMTYTSTRAYNEY